MPVVTERNVELAALLFLCVRLTTWLFPPDRVTTYAFSPLQSAAIVIIANLAAVYSLASLNLSKLDEAYNERAHERKVLIRTLKPALRLKVVEINDLLLRLTYKSMVRYLSSILLGNVRRRRARLVSLFAKELDEEELLLILRTVNVANMLFVGGPEFFKLFFSRVTPACFKGDVALKAMTISSVMLLDVLRYDRAARDFVLEILLSCRGAELVELKRRLDNQMSFHNFYKLTYVDMWDLSSEIIAHVKSETSTNTPTRRKVKTVSDVDDTFFSSGGRWPAGVDTRYPRKCIYPGVNALFEALDRRGGGNEEVDEANLVFLSARPHTFRDYSERRLYAKFRELYTVGKLYTAPIVLPGSLRSGFSAVSQDVYDFLDETFKPWVKFAAAVLLYLDDRRRGIDPNARLAPPASPTSSSSPTKRRRPSVGDSLRDRLVRLTSDATPILAEDTVEAEKEAAARANWEAVGKYKSETLLRFLELNPECDVLFFGDDGQGDIVCASSLGTRLSAAFIHRVASSSPPPPASAFGADPSKVVFFDNYVECALICHERGLITAEDLLEVTERAREEMIEQRISYAGEWREKMIKLEVDKLNKAISKVIALVGDRNGELGLIV